MKSVLKELEVVKNFLNAFEDKTIFEVLAFFEAFKVKYEGLDIVFDYRFEGHEAYDGLSLVIFQRQEENEELISGSSDSERIGLRDAAKILLAHSHFFSGKKPAQDK